MFVDMYCWYWYDVIDKAGNFFQFQVHIVFFVYMTPECLVYVFPIFILKT